MTTATERHFFDQYAVDRGDFNPFAPRGWQTLERRFVQFARPKSSDHILDVGCGTGHSRPIYSTHVQRYCGLDLSTEMIAVAHHSFPDVAWVNGNAVRLPFADRSFELVAFSSVLHHIDGFVAALREAHRVLKPGGRVFAFDPNVRHPAMALFRKPESPFYSAAGVSPNERPLCAKVLRDNFAAAGFQSIQQRCQSDIPYRRVAVRWMNMALSAYNAADWLWEHLGPGRWFGTFVITCGTKP